MDNKSDIIASKTCLGWVVYGIQVLKDDRVYHLCSCQSEGDNILHETIKEYYTLENYGICSPNHSMLSAEEQRANRILEATTILKTSHYECGLLWKFDNITLPSSYNMALQRLKCMERKLKTDPETATRFHNIIADYQKKGYIRKLTENEIKSEQQCWYLPVFTVTNPNKPGKLRIVWDAAAKVRGISLNSVLIKGPDLIVDLPGVLIRFRERRIAIAADISEMFHQVRTKSEDQNFQRFLYRRNFDEQPSHFAMTVMTFGACCSPCIAQHVKNTNADRFESMFPRAVLSVKSNHYVDDLLDCCSTEEEAIQLAQEVKHIHKEGGFQIRGWISNSSRVMTELGGLNQENKRIECDTGTNPVTEKVLGLFWNTKLHSFYFSLKFKKGNRQVLEGKVVPIKRGVLRIIMSIYDSLGLIGHCTIFPKILMQRLWRLKLEWDDPIPNEEFLCWKMWLKSLEALSNLSIPRWYKTTDTDDIQMHIFMDASEEAYSAVIYLRVQTSEGIHCSLVASKTKVAPIKSLTVPRLELLSALTGARLAHKIKSSLTLPLSKVIYWSDSMTVISWILSDTRNFKQFVASRICEILETTETEQWRWVPTKQNVADESTRMVLVDLKSNSRWFEAPEFLKQHESYWPERLIPNKTDEELRPHAIYHISFHDLNRNELRDGEESLFKHAQSEFYLDEISLLQSKKTIPKSSELYKLMPFLDSSNILRCNGRMQESNVMSTDSKTPVIMPRSSYITQLILQEYHEKFLHINFESAINEVRQRFFIRNLRAAMRKIRTDCQKCKIYGAHPVTPQMSPLPQPRVTAFIRPFSFVGVDYFGPLNITVGRHSEKRWGVLFTCLSIRAIHIEVSHNLTTDSCIQSIQRFIYRRGQPLEFFSDNATNLRGASKELLCCIKEIDKYAVANRFVNSNTTWNFIPPQSPHMGGVWEVMVRLVKRCLEKVMPSRNPNEELLQTMFAEAEFIVNSRPLCYIPIESENNEAITPNHLILGSSSGVKPFTPPSDEHELIINSWKKSLQIGNYFWKRFVKEVLPTLLIREKWHDPVRELQVGDIVVIIDEKNSRGAYPKGKIIEIHPSKKDGLIRKATVQTTQGVYVRPTTMLAVLRIQKEGSNALSTSEALPGRSDNSAQNNREDQ